MNTTGTIFNKSTQILDYADNLHIICRSEVTVKKVFKALERTAKDMGLVINTNKTKYMRAPRPKLNQPLQIDGREIESISEFNYLASI